MGNDNSKPKERSATAAGVSDAEFVEVGAEQLRMLGMMSFEVGSATDLADSVDKETEDDNDDLIDLNDADMAVAAALSGGGGQQQQPQSKKALKIYKNTELKNEEVIGEGGFGRVLKGKLHSTPVAIKIFHDPIPMGTMYGDLAKLTQLRHRNVVTVLGIIKSEIIDCPKIVLHYFHEGNLLQYLRRKENPQDYAMLGKLALDIIEGCEYLHQRKIIHGNLAARNILVEKAESKHKTHYNAKVSDYGIIQFINGSGANYMKAPNGKVLPIRWVPKELLESCTDFTRVSDIWSFGVLLWEMWTKGADPYGSGYSNREVMQFILEGMSPLKMHRPKGCPDHVVAVMESMFNANPKDRPNFTMLKVAFQSFRAHGKDKMKAKGDGESDGKSQKNDKQHDEAKTGCREQAQGANAPPKFGGSQNEKRTKKPPLETALSKSKASEDCDGGGDDSGANKNQNSTAKGANGQNAKTAKSKQNQPKDASTPNQKQSEQQGTAKRNIPKDQKLEARGNSGNPHRGGSGNSTKQGAASGKSKHPQAGRPHFKGQGRPYERPGGPGFNSYPQNSFPPPMGHPMNFSGPMDNASLMMMPPAPPPYSPNPLPNHAMYSGHSTGPGGRQTQFPLPVANPGPYPLMGAGTGAAEGQKIKKLESEIKMLKMNQELMKKTAELNAFAQKIAELSTGDQNQQKQGQDRPRDSRNQQGHQPRSNQNQNRNKSRDRNNSGRGRNSQTFGVHPAPGGGGNQY